MLPRASARHYRSQQRLQLAARANIRRAWRGMGAEFDASWLRIRPQMLALVAAAQAQAARAGLDYVSQALRETDQDVAPQARPQADAFVGTASDGRQIDSLLYGGVTHAKRAVDAGAGVAEALVAGQRFLDMAVLTQVADTARSAAGVAITVRPQIGWVRMVNPPCCSRCAVLAGRWYRWSTGFQRHPRCDCRHIPSREDRADDFTTDPQQLVDRGLVNDLTKAERDALAEGADFTQVVNARRGRKGMTTSEGITRAGRLRQQTGLRVRLTPEGIYRQAENRDDAIRLLQLHGYVL